MDRRDRECWPTTTAVVRGRVQFPMLKRVPAVLACLLLVAAGTTACTSVQSSDASPAVAVKTSTTPAAPVTTTGARPTSPAADATSPTRSHPFERAPEQAASPAVSAQAFRPTRVRVPAIGIDTDLRRLRLTDDGRIGVPSNPDEVGWYRSGGPVVLIGHVDSKTGPAIFFRLSQLSRGSLIDLETQDGTSKIFEVEEVIETKKTQFPTDRVYGNDGGVGAKNGLRLVTCGGTFDRKSRHYTSNVIVFARALPTLTRDVRA